MHFLNSSSLLVLSLGLCACKSAITAPNAPNASPVDAGSPPPAGSGVLANFVGAGGYAGKGSVRFTAQNGVGRLEFSGDFSVSPLPGPFVYLNTTNNPNSGQPLRVSALRSNSGAQTYAFNLPSGVRYTFVLVWCDPFNRAIAEAAIPPTS